MRTRVPANWLLAAVACSALACGAGPSPSGDAGLNALEVARFGFEAPSGGTVVDVFGQGNHGTLHEGGHRDVGRFGQGLVLAPGAAVVEVTPSVPRGTHNASAGRRNAERGKISGT